MGMQVHNRITFLDNKMNITLSINYKSRKSTINLKTCYIVYFPLFSMSVSIVIQVPSGPVAKTTEAWFTDANFRVHDVGGSHRPVRNGTGRVCPRPCVLTALKRTTGTNVSVDPAASPDASRRTGNGAKDQQSGL